MTDTELIEKAAQAMADAGDVGWSGHTESERDWYRRDARVALAVFREHTAPTTDDEREALAKIIDAEASTYDPVTAARHHYLHESLTLAGGSDMAERIADKVLRAGFRRGAPAEPARQDFMPGVIEALDNLTIRKGE